ncbi:hypothetical protein HD806DRAFT_503172 [Xylariaceae sp. AK1471]|nr:hypothetical protein HD806DRAFT_503172 [Xylariaceae sp. AK1471]
MSAPGITYSGVLAKKNADNNEKAGVFQDLKLWVSVRVPHRKTYVDTIQDNGGTVVLKEKDADMLICDPAKDPASSSYSYQLIEDAVTEGSLDTKEDYLCGSPANHPGPSRPSTKPKLTRNKFTEEDDRILTRFVTEMERLCEPIGGNDIYKNFADEHPHHTWQSWRDRWVKKLRSIPHPHESNKEHSPPPKGTPVASHRGVASDRSPVIKTRTRFTAEEDEILLETIHEAIDGHEPWNGYIPYKRLATDFPQRTYQSWRDRALNHVAKQNKNQIAQWEAEAGFHMSDAEDVPTNNPKDQRTRTSNDKGHVKSPAAVSLQGAENTTIPTVKTIDGLRDKGTTRKDVGENENEQEHQDMSSSPKRTTRSTERSHDVRLSVEGNVSNNPASPVANSCQFTDAGVAMTTAEQFYRDYNTFLESIGANTRPLLSVGGKAIALWDLWQSVRSKKVETVELDWQQIAEDLYFDWVSFESIPEDLRKCYEEHLAPFAEAMMSFNDSSDEESIEEDADTRTERPLPSSPPVLSSLKRSLAVTSPTYEKNLPHLSPKRRKVDHTDEIPSTPDDVNGTSHLRYLHDPDKPPSSSRLRVQSFGRAMPQTPGRASAVNEEDEEMRDGLSDLPVLPQGRKRRLEPETQDFNFDPDTQLHARDETPDHADSDSQQSTTPSQQLVLESAAITPEIQHDAPVLAGSNQSIVHTTPTPRRRFRNPSQQDDSNDDTRRNTKGTRTAAASLSTQKTQPKRRSLPTSIIYKSSAPANSSVPQDDQRSSATVPETESRRKPLQLKETPEDIIDRFVSFGYSREIVLRSLKATTWIIGNAGQVMEMLKQGEPLPQRTTGVWTQRDDESLALVYSNVPPANSKEEKKRAKEMRRLQAKHGAEQVTLRKKYLLDELPT